MSDPIMWLQKERGLDAELLKSMGVTVKTHDKLGQVIAFPYRRKGENYAAKFRTVDKKFLSTRDVTRGLYNEDALFQDAELPIVITEGEIDCLSVIQSGQLRCVSLPDGWTEQGNKTESLIAVEEQLQNSPFIVVAGDNDKAGESLPKTVASLMAGHDVRYVTWPKDCKDANDVLLKFGESAVAKAINTAKRLDPPGGMITGISDMPPVSSRRVLKTGRYPLDQVVALELGTMSVVTGLPGCGKSTFTTFIGDEIAKHEDIRCGLIGFETHPHQTRDQLARSNTKTAWRKLSKEQKLKLGADLDARWRIVHYTPDESDNHLGWLEDMIKTLAVRDRCKLIIIDPWNELEHLPEPGESITQYINFALKRIRQLARKLEIHIVVVAHPKKINTDKTPRPPVGYDVADSAAFFNKPALGLTVHPGDEKHEVQIINWKVRDTMLYGIGKGKVTVEFAEAWAQYNPTFYDNQQEMEVSQ